MSDQHSRLRRASFWVAAFLLSLFGAESGICALAGACGMIWGPPVFQAGDPDWSQTYPWVMVSLLIPAILLGLAGACLPIALLAAWLRVPLFEIRAWRGVVGLFSFLRRARYVATVEERGRDEDFRQRILRASRPWYYLFCLCVGGTAGGLWSVGFDPLMYLAGEPIAYASTFERFAVPIAGFAVAGLIVGWIVRRFAANGSAL